MGFAYDINDPRTAVSDATEVQKLAQNISDYCDSLIYVCDQIVDNWDSDDGTYFVDSLRAKADAIRNFANGGVYNFAMAVEQYADAMIEITSRSAK